MQEVLKNCRCCLKSPASDYFNEFEEFNKNVDHSQKIVDLFESLTSIKVNFADLENSKICRDCLEKLKNSYEFREMCLNSNKRIQEAIFKTEPGDPIIPEYSEFVTVKLELKSEITEENYMVPEDDEFKVDRKSTKISKRESGVTVKSKVKGKKAEIKKKIKTATVRKTSKAKSTIIKSKKDTAIKDNDVPKEDKLPKKRGRKPSIGNSYTCSYCAKIFQSRQLCSRHEKYVHIREMKFSCDHCEKKYMKKILLLNHLYTHFNIKNHACDLCPKTFATNQQKLAHKRCFHGLVKKDFACSYCDKIFFNKHRLNDHLKIHTDEKPFKCSFEGCERAFRIKGVLKQHEKTHLQKTLECDICGAKDLQISHYHRHMKQHEIEASNILFTCEICSKTFKRKSNLWSHKKHAHSGLKQYGCCYCDMKFVMRNKLMTHIYAIHISNTFQCELCPQTFKLKRCYQREYITHVEDHHTELNPEELDSLKRKIKGLKIEDLATDYPDIPVVEVSKDCPNCNFRFMNAQQLEIHLKSKCTKA